MPPDCSILLSDLPARDPPKEAVSRPVSTFFKKAVAPPCSRKDAKKKQKLSGSRVSCSDRCSSPNSSATTTAAASTAQTPSSVALLAGGAPALPLVFPPLGVAVVREEVGIPLSKHWLPKDTQHNPLDGAHSLLRQLERLSPVYSEYETALATYEAKSTAPGSRCKSTNMSTTKAIGL